MIALFAVLMWCAMAVPVALLVGTWLGGER